ncbi:hypothetical protein [Persicitalea sp.]
MKTDSKYSLKTDGTVDGIISELSVQGQGIDISKNAAINAMMAIGNRNGR